MLRLIPAFDQQGKTAEELEVALEERGYAVTRRTIERDLDSLQTCMPLQLDEKARPQRWRWQKGRSLDVPGMESAEAMALFMMHDAMHLYLPGCFVAALKGRFTQAEKTLQALARSGANVRWADRVRVLPSHVVLHPPRIAPRILQQLQHALLNEVPVDATYQSANDAEPRERRLYPRALLLRGSALYLVAHSAEGGEPRHYAVQRFGAVKLKELETWPAGKFSLGDFLKDGRHQFGEGTEIVLKAQISKELARTLGDSPLGDDMRIDQQGNGHSSLTVTVRDTWALRTWILGHAESITVVAPKALAAAIYERLKGALEGYSQG